MDHTTHKTTLIPSGDTENTKKLNSLLILVLLYNLIKFRKFDAIFFM